MSKEKFKPFFPISVTADVVIFTIFKKELAVILVRRALYPFKNALALPGGFVKENETAHEAALRVLKEKAKLKNIYIEQLYTFDAPKRDPRGRIVSMAHMALAKVDPQYSFELISTNNLPKLAFDHNKIINYALKRLQAKLEYTNVTYSLLPPKFTLYELRSVYEIIFGKKLDKRNFIKKFKTLGLLKATREYTASLHQRPAQLYSFRSQTPQELKKFF